MSKEKVNLRPSFENDQQERKDEEGIKKRLAGINNKLRKINQKEILNLLGPLVLHELIFHTISLVSGRL